MRRSEPFNRAVECLWRNPAAGDGYSHAVSLHSHTIHSREGLDFIPRVFAKVPGLSALLDYADFRRQRSIGRRIDYDRAFWQPPLNAQAAHDLEASQIRSVLGLHPLVSLTDHDNIEACADLHALGNPVPLSTEWTVPYKATMFHIGVHNLPPTEARALMAQMALYTATPDPRLLASLLGDLDAMRNVLIVLNHPLCNEERCNRLEHLPLLGEFLDLHGACMHALELNGLQPAADNCDVMRIAAGRGMPVISGGDRHCLEPNANVNLTNAATFEAFVDEVRREGMSRVLFLPQYRESIPSRYIEFIAHAIQTYPAATGRARWVDRVFYDHEELGLRTLAELSPEGLPAPLHWFVAAVAFVGAPRLRSTRRFAFGEQGSVEA